MGLNALTLSKLMDRLKPGDAVASMGYPDIIYQPERLAALGDRIKGLKYRPDSEEICKRHGIERQQIPDAESLFELFGASLDVYDITAERGGEIVMDLNKPYPENSKEQYEWVLDCGTVEHCFNIAQAAFNMAAMVKVGGHIFHETPWNWGNHGFYSLQPTWFHDFYEANGFEVIDCRLTGRDYKQSPHMGPNRFHYSGVEVVLMCEAKRLGVRNFVFPTQKKYREK